MKTVTALACAGLLAAAFVPVPASAGCLKSGAVGAVVGHMAGHGKAGAAVGCAVGAAKKSKAKKQQAQPAPQGQPGNR
jgi:hypothetical protein